MNFSQILMFIATAMGLAWVTGQWNPSTSPGAIAPQSVGIASQSAIGSCAEVTAPLLNVRTAPNGQRLAVLRRGERVQVTGVQRSGWSQIQRPNGRAWVFSQYVRSSGC